MSDDHIKADNPAIAPTKAEVEHRAAELAKSDGLIWAAPGTPEQGAEGHPGGASEADRERYRKLARERLEAERGLIIE